MQRYQAWVLTGPTGIGKTAVAHRLAVQMNAVVLCADSMAIYRNLDIGTAKPEPALQAEVPYRGINLINPDEPFSVGAYLEVARHAADEAAAAGRPLIIVGGTGLYISALLRGLDVRSEADPVRRAHWERIFEENGLAGLHAALKALDARALEQLADPQNPRRVIRALERAEAGEVASSWTARTLRPVVALRMDSALLRARIEARARQMMESGLIEEARQLRTSGVQLSPTAQHAIGYAEAFAVLDGVLTGGQAVARIASRTWQLARRQMTWLRHQIPVSWTDAAGEMALDELAARVRGQWEQDGATPLYI